MMDDFDESKQMTPEELRGFPGFEHYNDEEAYEIIYNLSTLARITVEFYMDLQNIGALDKDGNIIEDHPEIIRRREACKWNPSSFKKRGRKRLSEDEKKANRRRKRVAKKAKVCNPVAFDSTLPLRYHSNK